MEIVAERARQAQKGYDAAHDDKHADGALAHHAAHAIGPMFYTDWVRADTRRQELIAGIALAVAEVERMDRISPVSA